MHGESKLEYTILAIINSVDNPSNIGATKLNKICWRSDVENFIRVGESITGATYKKQKRGPVVKEMLLIQNKLIDEKKVAMRELIRGSHTTKILIPLVDSDLSVFTPDEVKILLRNANDICSNYTAKEISEESHDRVWESFDIEDDIPLCTYLVGEDADITQDDIAWGLESLK